MAARHAAVAARAGSVSCTPQAIPAALVQWLKCILQNLAHDRDKTAGVVGGTVFAVILTAVSLAVIVKLRTGHWLFAKKQPGDGDGDHFSDELGTLLSAYGM